MRPNPFSRLPGAPAIYDPICGKLMPGLGIVGICCRRPVNHPGECYPTPMLEDDERYKLRAALQKIADLPKRIGYFNGADAATEAVQIAKEALEIE